MGGVPGARAKVLILLAPRICVQVISPRATREPSKILRIMPRPANATGIPREDHQSLITPAPQTLMAEPPSALQPTHRTRWPPSFCIDITRTPPPQDATQVQHCCHTCGDTPNIARSTTSRAPTIAVTTRAVLGRELLPLALGTLPPISPDLVTGQEGRAHQPAGKDRYSSHGRVTSLAPEGLVALRRCCH
jgi:hypothetical protein